MKPSLVMPEIEAEALGQACCRKAKEDPMSQIPKAKSAEGMWAGDLIGIMESDGTWSITGKVLPMLDALHMLSLKPSCAGPLMSMEASMCKRSGASTAELGRESALGGIKEPRLVASATGSKNTKPKQPKPITNAGASMRAILRSGDVSPACVISKTDVNMPERPRLRKKGERPIAARSVANIRKPVQAEDRVKSGRPKCEMPSTGSKKMKPAHAMPQAEAEEAKHAWDCRNTTLPTMEGSKAEGENSIHAELCTEANGPGFADSRVDMAGPRWMKE